MVGPTMMTMLVPKILGFLLCVPPMGAYLIVVNASSDILASTQFNSIGVIANAKKIVGEGLFDGKDLETHTDEVISDISEIH